MHETGVRDRAGRCDGEKRMSLAGVKCPRCGYDLDGEVSRWAEACPLAGRCVECGLEIRWGLLAVGGRSRWSFEGPWPVMVRRLAGTVARAAWPGALWRRDGGMAMETRVCPGRLAVLGGVLLMLGAAVWLVVTVGSGVMETQRRVYWGRGWMVLGNLVPTKTLRGEFTVLALHGSAALAMPLAALLFSTTLREAKVRRRHVARCAVYALGPLLSTILLVLAALKFDVLARGLWVRAPELVWWLAVTPVVMAWWWGRTLTLYMRVRHGLATGVLMAAVSWLAALVMGTLLFGRTMGDLAG